MSFTLAELEQTILDIPRAAGGSFGAPDSQVIHRAARWAIDKWLRDTKYSRATVTVDLAEDDDSVDIVADHADFEPGRLLLPPVIVEENEPLFARDYLEILDQRRNGGGAGIPALIIWLSRDDAQFYPACDDDYTLQLVYWRTAPAFEPGTDGDAVDIDIPSSHLGDVAMGALGYLMKDFPGQRGAECMMEFREALRQAISDQQQVIVYQSEPGRVFNAQSYLNSSYVP